MDEEQEREALKELYKVDNLYLFVALMNYYSNIKTIKDRMTDALDLLDSVADGNEKDKKRLRKLILDNFNDLPRDTLELISELTSINKE